MDDRHDSDRTDKNKNIIHQKSNDIPDIKYHKYSFFEKQLFIFFPE